MTIATIELTFESENALAVWALLALLRHTPLDSRRGNQTVDRAFAAHVARQIIAIGVCGRLRLQTRYTCLTLELKAVEIKARLITVGLFDRFLPPKYRVLVCSWRETLEH